MVFEVLTTKSRTERQLKSKFEVQFQQNSCLIDHRKLNLEDADDTFQLLDRKNR